MGMFGLINDFIGVNKSKLTEGLRDSVRNAKEQRDKLRNCSRIRGGKLNK